MPEPAESVLQAAPDRAEVVICGAGIAGVAAAYHLTARRGVRDVVLVDERPPLTLTSDKSTEAYRDWWPGPDDAMIRLMGRSIDLLEELAEESGNFFHLNRRGYLYASADPARAAALEETARLGSAQGAGPLRRHTGAGPLRRHTGAGPLRRHTGAGPLRRHTGAGPLRRHTGAGPLRRHTGAGPPQGHSGAPLQPAYVAGASSGYRGQPTGADLILDRQAIRRHFPYLSGQTRAVLHARRCGWLSGQQLGM